MLICAPSFPLARKCLGLAFFMGATMAVAEQPASRCSFPQARLGGVENAHTRFVETHLFPAIVEPGAKPFVLQDRMGVYGVPGVSVAVIHNGKLEWARGWGVRDADTCEPVTPETDFQAASISKVVTALTALRLVEQGKLSLDRDINDYLTSWKLPANHKVAPKSVTLRQLLSHTAGLNVHGFPGYLVGSPLPTAEQVLDGTKPANTEAVRLVLPAGQQWRYSGGGYVITQVALRDVTGQSFNELAEQEVFRPLGMRRSAFAQPPSSDILNNAASAHSDGKVISGKYHLYPELGPAGLWTTPSDLAKMLLDLQASAKGGRSKLLSPRMTAEMLTSIKGDWGLGPALYGAGPGKRFGHDGVNEGFESTMIAYVGKGDGVIVMTNGRGKRLADEIVRAVATSYGWTELASKPIVEAQLSMETLAGLAGRYEGGGLSVHLDLRDGHLFAQTGGPYPERLFALTPRRFKTDGTGMVVEFENAPDGTVSGFRIVEGGPPITFARAAASVSDPFDTALFLRGSMNAWSTSTPLTKTSDGTLTAEIALAAGDYQFKIGSEDWQAADFGVSGTSSVQEAARDVPLIPRGGNIRLTIESPGTYRFRLKRAGSGGAFSIERVTDR